MTKAILDPSASLMTQATPRSPSNTETPEPAPDPTESGFAKFLAQDEPESSTSLFRFVSGSQEHGIAPSGTEVFLVSSSQDQAHAILEAPGADFSAGLQNVLCTLPLVAPGEEFVPPEVMKRLLSRVALIVPQRVPSSTSTQARRRYDCFRSKLIAALLDEPIEDGVTHPAERVIEEALRTNSSECRDWLARALNEHYQTRPSISASIVRCVGRVEFERVGRWGMRVADDALWHKDVEVREAAIRALEAWGGRESLDMLRRHKDTEAWLNEYVQQVVVDLSGSTL